jgi:CheY-like chemotaxis protein/signal transduction histidine kinase/CHASE3 domain sensor protein
VSTASARLFRRGGVRLQFLTAYGLLLTLLVLTCLTVAYAVLQVRELRTEVARVQALNAGIQELLLSALDQETGLRGFLLARDERFLEPYRDGAARYDRAYTEVRARGQEDAGLLPYLLAIDLSMQQWRRDFAQPALALAAAGDDGSAVRAFAREGRGKAVMDRLRQEVKEALDYKAGVLETRRLAVDRLLLQAFAAALIVLMVGLLTGLLALRQATRRITTPLSRLTERMAQLAERDTDFDVPYRELPGEVGDIARALEVFRRATQTLSDQEWVQARAVQLSALLRQAPDTAAFGRVLVQQLGETLAVPALVLHELQAETQALVPIAAWGAAPREDAVSLSSPQPVAECAREGRTRWQLQVPATQMRLASGLRDGPPWALRLEPLRVGEQSVAVLELGLQADLDRRGSDLLENLLPVAALAFEALRRRLATEQLLIETQAQRAALAESEEQLRAQQEELQATNEALREQARQLEDQRAEIAASEEEARAQAEELRVANQSLQEQQAALEEAQQALGTKAEDLERASRYKSEFLANMSHELRTPLNSLLILSKSLAENAHGHLDAEEVESAQIVYDAGSQLLRLINDILDLSKVEAGKMAIHVEPVSIAALSASLDRQFQPLAQSRGLKFQILRNSDVPETLETDGARLTQILTNLIGNALKFTEQGGVRLRIERPSGSADAGQQLAFRVSDSGIGIPPEQLSRIFGAFEQADGSTSRRYGGTGLGLSISLGFARLLGGELQAESTPGRGSTFTLLLPTTAPTAKAPATPPGVAVVPRPLPASTPVGHEILIIEDDLTLANVLADIARRRGYAVRLAHSGDEGLAAARVRPPGGILLDIGLPGLDGWSVFEALKSDPLTRQVPVHFISGDDAGARALAEGAVGFLQKPVTREAVVEALARIAAPGKTAERLLLVDDDPASRTAVERLVRPLGVAVEAVASGAEGLRVLQAGGVDCLILDLGLPDISGFEFLERAAADGRKLPPVVVYSARELTREETLRLREYTDSIVIKGERASERLLDEVTLFLHALPSAPPPSPSPAPINPPAPTPALQGRSVLIVDDDMRNIFALSKALRARGLKVIMAQDGPKALAQLKSQAGIDIVLMDIMMPGMDGYACIREIRAHPGWAQLPIIAVTAKAMRGDAEACLAAGANDYAPKPIDVERLCEQMVALVGQP